MILTASTLPRLIDICVVKSNYNESDVYRLAEICKQYRFICAFSLNAYYPLLKSLLRDEPDIHVGYNAGYPSGGDTTENKLFQVREAKALKVDELDCVINVGQLRSGRDQWVQNELEAIVREASPIPVKVIIEATLLSDDEIRTAARLVVQSGARYIKTGTGWLTKPTTLHQVQIIKEVVGDEILIKAAGGIDSVETIAAMIRAGVSRFGMSYERALLMLDEISKYPQGLDC